MNLPRKIVRLHQALHKAGLPHAFGGALALAWCTGRARGTIDIDVNIFVEAVDGQKAIDAMPHGVAHHKSDLEILQRDGQVRLWWSQTPVDLFLNTTAFHVEASRRIRWEQFMNTDLPFLSCNDLAVFKVFFNRGKDWVDLEEMQHAGTLDINAVSAVILAMLGAGDERLARLTALRQAPP
ncbi:MAG: hypothetical protein ACR2PZ_26525 [Pseudomonadales bacterium]